MAQPTPIPGATFPSHAGSFSQSPRHRHPRSSFDMARADLQRRSRTPSRGASRGASPRLRATSIGGDINDALLLSGRDESAFYQAETQMLVRENQMLKHRIRELGKLMITRYFVERRSNINKLIEKQLSETQTAPAIPHEPSNPSHLAQTVTTAEGGTEANPPAST